MKYSLTCMTFNLRVVCEGDGINMFFHRAPRILEVLKQEQPDVVGFQEVTDSMRAWLRAHLEGYTVVGCGRDSQYHGESMLFAYKTDHIELISLEHLWLSPTPHTPGSTFGGDQSACPRMMVSALLKHNQLARPFRFINTHLDHIGAHARYLGAMQLVQYLSEHPEPFVLTGDFNALPDTPEIRLIPEALAYRGAIDATAGLPGTFHDFGRLKGDAMQKIDYIFTDGVCEQAHVVEDIPVEGMYYSDHSAVVARICLPDRT